MNNTFITNDTMGLASANRRLQAVLDNASVAIFLMDDRQQCIYMNNAAAQLTGYTLPEVVALDRPLHDIIHYLYPDGRPFPLEECAIDRAFPEHSQMRGEETFVHRGGDFYPVAYCASPIVDDSSQTVGTIIEVRDISQERLAARQQRMLVNELNHRVKNTLATAQALARQTFRRNDPAALASFTGRLAALARAHDVLTSNAWESAELGDVVASAVRPFGPERFTLAGAQFRISPKLALSLSMAIHELATNAAKYGSLSAKNGEVGINWMREPGPDGSVLTVVWEESGGPLVRPPTHTGYGMQLIQDQLAYEFGGEAELDFSVGGLVCRLTFRMSVDAPAEPLRPA